MISLFFSLIFPFVDSPWTRNNFFLNNMPKPNDIGVAINGYFKQSDKPIII